MELDVLLRVLLVAAALFVETFQRLEVAGVESLDKFSERLSSWCVRQLDLFIRPRCVGGRCDLRAYSRIRMRY
jgi:hypothetical protein